MITWKGSDHLILLHFRGPTDPLPLPVKTGGPSGEMGNFTYILYFRSLTWPMSSIC